MLRITRIDTADGSTTLRLEGRVTEEEMELLLQTGSKCLLEDRRLTLDLAALFFVDLAGVRAIRDLQARGAALNFTGCSPFISELLREAS
jgi:anti-anti-sigma regulatory factor